MKPIIQKLWMIIAILCSSISASAYDFEVDGICYDIISFSEFTARASSISESKEEINIPSTVEYNGKTLTVTSVGDNFVKGNENIRVLKIGSGIIEIGSDAFNGCSKLTTIEIPKTVTKFGSSAFANCVNILSIEALGLESVSQNCFLGCSSLERFNFPRLLDIAPNGFQDCINLKELKCENIKSIGNSAFSNCKSLISVDAPSLISVGENAFYGCENLSMIEFPSLQYVKERAFANCYAIEDFILPDKVSDMPNDLFLGCSSLKSVSISPNINSIKSNPFSGCVNLKKLVFRDGSIPLVFDIKEGKLVMRIEDIGYVYNCFGDLPIEELYLGRPISSSNYDRESCLYLPFVGSGTLRTVEFGSYVTFIPPSYYYNYTNPSIREKSTVGYFESCSKLESIKFKGNSNVQIGTKAFSKCTSLETVLLSHNVTSIDDKAFEQCSSIRDLSIGYYCWWIGSNAFEGCSAISNIDVYAPNPPSCGEFSRNIYTTAKLNIPLGSMDKYKNKSPWNNFWNISEDSSLLAFFTLQGIKYEVVSEYKVRVVGVDVDEPTNIILTKNITYENHSFELIDIAEDAFKNNNYINSIQIPDNIVELPDALFSGCKELSKVILPSHLTSLSNNMFKDCIKLKDIAIPKSVVSIGAYCFNNCTSLETMDLTDNDITEMTEGIFSNCHSLKELQLPITTNAISDNAFLYCSNLESVQFKNIRTIGKKALYGCSNISELCIPSSCVFIDDDAFGEMTSLKSIVFECGGILSLGHSGLTLSNSITPFPNPSDVDERRTGFRNGYYDGLFYGLPIEHLVINRDIELPKYYERTKANATSSYSTVYDDILYYPPFYGLPNLKSVEIGENVSAICMNQVEAVVNAVPTTMKYTNFGKCDNIEVVVSNNPNAPVGGGFSNTVYANATLFLPNGGEESYRNDDYWKNFNSMSETSYVPIESISFDSDSLVLRTNKSKTLQPNINPDDSSIKALKWSSSKPSIVQVSDDGVITASSYEGVAKITASSCDGTGISASIIIVVRKGGTGLSEATGDSPLYITVENGKIFVHEKADSDIVSVFNVHGQLITSTKENVIDINTKGIYIVKVGSISKKVII
ncbi:MAG: leucine-rich repeat protein [Muribaculaceae bacterium]|nr:leucine-rich repeat protein [Muribaculaceae bacterium]